MTDYETFVPAIGYTTLILFILAVIGVGGVLTVISAAVCLVEYYPIKLFGWLDGKIFKKGNK